MFGDLIEMNKLWNFINIRYTLFFNYNTLDVLIVFLLNLLNSVATDQLTVWHQISQGNKMQKYHWLCSKIIGRQAVHIVKLHAYRTNKYLKFNCMLFSKNFFLVNIHFINKKEYNVWQANVSCLIWIPSFTPSTPFH